MRTRKYDALSGSKARAYPVSAIRLFAQMLGLRRLRHLRQRLHLRL